MRRGIVFVLLAGCWSGSSVEKPRVNETRAPTAAGQTAAAPTPAPEARAGTSLMGPPLAYQRGGMFGDPTAVVVITGMPAIDMQGDESRRLQTAIDDASDLLLACCEQHLNATNKARDTAVVSFTLARDGRVVRRSGRGFAGAGTCVGRGLAVSSAAAGQTTSYDVELACQAKL